MTRLAWTVIVGCISATFLSGAAPIARAATVLIDDPLHGHCLAGCIRACTHKIAIVTAI